MDPVRVDLSQAMSTPKSRDHEDRLRVLSLLKRYGWNATSFQSLEPGIQYWFDETGEAGIAYVDTGQAWVVAGAPIAPLERLTELARQFVDRAGQTGRRVCFFATERRFAGQVSLRSLPIGEQPVWDPAEWPEILSSSRSLREQLRRARAKGVTVRLARPEELVEPDGRLRRDIEGIVHRWLERRSMAPLGFLVQVSLFSFTAERRILIAELAGKAVGFLAIVPVYARSGWLMEDLLRDPSSPNGTTELLIDEAMRLAVQEESHYMTLGLAPLSGEVGRWLRLARTLGSRLYSFHGVRAFKAKLRPRHWEPIYLSFPADQSALLTMCDVLGSFAPRGLVKFAMETLLRSPAPAIRALASLLLPWTLLLALADTTQWFPAREVQIGWVLFDVVLLVGLVALARRWRLWLVTLLAALTSADALCSVAQVVIFNLPRTRTPVEVGIVAVGVASPLLASAFLWAARGYQGRPCIAGGGRGE